MKKTTISLGLISALSLTLLGGISAFANDNTSPAPHPPVAQKAEKSGKPSERSGQAAERPAPKDSDRASQNVLESREQSSEPGLNPPPPRRQGPSAEERQAEALKEAAALAITTDGKKIEDLEQEIHLKELESIADLLKSVAEEAQIKTDGLSLEEMQQLLKTYYYAKMDELKIKVRGDGKQGPRQEQAPTPSSSWLCGNIRWV